MAIKNITSLIIHVIGVTAIAASAFNIHNQKLENHQHPIQFNTVPNSQYNFHVYCPISSELAQKYYSKYIESSNITVDLYVVFVRPQNISRQTYVEDQRNFTTSKISFYYCGWARTWLGTCEDAQHVCSFPGPMFHLPIYREATIAWVNDVQAEGFQWDQVQCYAKDSNDTGCELKAKIIDQDHPETEGCTFYEVTNFSYPTKKVRIDPNHYPISPHIHGIEVRPAFDGNPYSWFNNNGDKGPGYFSLADSPEYFTQFDTPVVSEIKFLTEGNHMKVIKVTNKQSAGTMFYHDHTMKSTKYNVLRGLIGMYVLYNETAEQHLPRGSEEKYFLFSASNDFDFRERKQLMSPSWNEKQPESEQKQTFSRNMTYRFRILNAHYQNFFYNVSFGVYSETIRLKNKTIVKRQLDPAKAQNQPREFFTKINFTVIGTDSHLFNEPIHNLDTFNLSNAERIDILIKFGAQNGVPQHFNHVYLICYQKSIMKYRIKQDFPLNNLVVENKYADPVDTLPLNVPFYNLSNIPKSQIALSRMRPLISRPAGDWFVINGHFMIDSGEVERPQIGTVEDWFLIGSQTCSHVMHFHLVNFQLIKIFTLKHRMLNCSMYELDFFRFSNYSKFANMSDVDLCIYLNTLTVEESARLFAFTSNYNLESEKRHSSMGMVSGLNLMDPIVTEADRKKYAQHNCSLNKVYKYICEDESATIRDYYRRWKDTVHVAAYHAVVVRVRWTHTGYDESIKDSPYFNEEEDVMIEFPGFVLHCHMLLHEDEQMMRSIMLAPSDRYLETKRNQSYNRHLSSDKNFHQVKKKHYAQDLWFLQARKINKNLNCPS